MKVATPVTYPFIIIIVGLVSLPSNLFIMSLGYNEFAWKTGLDATPFDVGIMIWVVISFSIQIYLIIGAVKMLKDTETES